MAGPDHGNYVPALRYRWLTPYYDAVVVIATRERTFKTALIAQAGLESGYQVLDLKQLAPKIAIRNTTYWGMRVPGVYSSPILLLTALALLHLTHASHLARARSAP